MLRRTTLGRHVRVAAASRTAQPYGVLHLTLSTQCFTRPHPSLTERSSRGYSTAPSPRPGEPVSTSRDPPPNTLHIPRKPKLDLHPAPKKVTSLSDTTKPPNPSSPIPHASPTSSSSTVSPGRSPIQNAPPISLQNGLGQDVYPASSSAIQLAIEDMRKATQHGIFAPPPENAGKIKRTWHQIKEFFKFYVRGMKLLWVHRGTVIEIKKRLREDAKDGKPAQMTRWEWQFVRTYSQDRIKLIPFIIILIVLEEALPLVALYMPFLLPSTCILPSQRERMEAKAEKDRRAGIVAIKAWLARQGQRKASADFLKAVTSGATSRSICQVFSLPAWGPGFVQRRRLDQHLQYLATDDSLLMGEGKGSRLSELELRLALRERGFLTHELPDTELRPLLAEWLEEASGSGRIAAAVGYAAKVDI